MKDADKQMKRLEDRMGVLERKINGISDILNKHFGSGIGRFAEGSEEPTPEDNWTRRIKHVVSKTMEHLDFDEIHTTMADLYWTWASSNGDVPTVDHIKATVEKMALEAFDGLLDEEISSDGYREHFVETGGFRIQVWEDKSNIGCRIDFILTSSEFSTDLDD